MMPLSPHAARLHTTTSLIWLHSLFAQVRRDDVLAIQTALGGPNVATFHEACRAAFTQSVDNLTRSDPGGAPLRTDQTVTQPGIDTTSNDIAYGQYTFNDYDYGGRVGVKQSVKANLTCTEKLQAGTIGTCAGCCDTSFLDGSSHQCVTKGTTCYPMTMAGEVHLAGVVDHTDANENLRNLSVPYVPLGGGVDGGDKSPTGFVRRWLLKPRTHTTLTTSHACTHRSRVRSTKRAGPRSRPARPTTGCRTMRPRTSSWSA